MPSMLFLSLGLMTSRILIAGGSNALAFAWIPSLSSSRKSNNAALLLSASRRPSRLSAVSINGAKTTTDSVWKSLTDFDPDEYLKLPRHSDKRVDEILAKTEGALQALHLHAQRVHSEREEETTTTDDDNTADSTDSSSPLTSHDKVFANSYVDLGKVDTFGFDYDYTLVTYKDELLELIYDMALNRLVQDRQYPLELLEAGLKFDPSFSIRGLAVDKETAWICHLSYTHKVAAAWEGREKLPTWRIYREYRAKRALRPSERRNRLKPLNDLFSMAECGLLADVVQFLKDSKIPFCPRNTVTDVLSTIRATHISGDFHRIVADHPERYFHPAPHLEQLLDKLKKSGKHLMFVSNSPFWYVDAGMKYMLGDNWRDTWDAVITSAGKPNFYTDPDRPFREVCQESGRLNFKKVDRFEPGGVYTEGCIRELNRLMHWHLDGNHDDDNQNKALQDNNNNNINGKGNEPPPLYGPGMMATSNVLYIGDSLFADLVDAKREYGWTTAAVAPEVAHEKDRQTQTDSVLAQRSIELLLNALRLVQHEWGPIERSKEDLKVLDALERLVSKWRDREQLLLGNPFGSIFRARYQPSLFAQSLRRYCDLYMNNVSCLRNYSPQHRFYPDNDHRLLAHEIDKENTECWALEDVLDELDKTTPNSHHNNKSNKEQQH